MQFLNFLIFELVLVFISSIDASDETTLKFELNESDFRLPTNLKPYLYELSIKTYLGDWYGLESFKFTGNVSIYFQCVTPTNRIILHSKGLSIDRSRIEIRSLSQNGNESIDDVNQTFDLDNDFLIVDLNKNCVKSNNYLMNISYSGRLLDGIYGYFKSSYVDSKKITHYVASTQFESVDARRAFPCFDEPTFKAQFDVSLTRPKMYKSWSNGKLLETHTLDGDWEKDVFTRTTKMSTYLVAFVISEYKSIGTVSKEHGIEVEIITRPEAVESQQANYALDFSSKLIDKFSDYFDNIYPLKKLTIASIPSFSGLAMENWGLITHSEDSLLFKPGIDSLSTQKTVTSVIAHEIAHQWFGDLVTMKWWNDIWLNEGFAAWFENIGQDLIYPEWKMEEAHYINNLQILVMDSLESSHPLRVDIKNNDQTNYVFDSISYNKGSSLLKMINAYLGHETFLNAIKNYLKNHQYSNTDQDDLWQDLNNEAKANKKLPDNLSIKQIMDNWTLQTGYPVITIQRDNTTITLTQRKFTINPFNNDSNTRWYVPVQIKSKSAQPSQFYWLQPDQNELKIETNASDDEYIIGNYGHTGFYRVNYDDKGWNLLINEIESNTSFDQLSKAQLLDDAFNLGKAQHIDQLVFLRLVKNLANETRDMPFIAANLGLDYMDFMLSNNFLVYKAFRDFYKNVFENRFNQIVWNEDSVENSEINFKIIEKMCLYGFKPCINRMIQYNDSMISNNKTFSPDLKTIIYRTKIVNGNQDDWFDVYRKYKNESSPPEKLAYLNALTSSDDIKLLETLLWDNLKNDVNSQLLWRWLATNPASKYLLWEFLSENWNFYIKKYAKFPDILSSLISSSIQRMNSNYELNKVEKFIDSNGDQLGIGLNRFKSSIENIKINIVWLERNLDKLNNFLSSE